MTDRSQRFEAIAACDSSTLTELADRVLAREPDLHVLQEPAPKLVMQRATDPLSGTVFNLGEVLVTAAEVRLDGEKGFAMVAGKTESTALAGAIVDAAVTAGHLTDPITTALEAALDVSEERRRRQWAESRATTVDFDVLEDPA